MSACQENLTSLLVRGAPSVHVMPLRKRYVTRSPSLLMSPFSRVGTSLTRTGTGLPLASALINGSKIKRSIMLSVVSDSSKAFRFFGSACTATRKTPGFVQECSAPDSPGVETFEQAATAATRTRALRRFTRPNFSHRRFGTYPIAGGDRIISLVVRGECPQPLSCRAQLRDVARELDLRCVGFDDIKTGCRRGIHSQNLAALAGQLLDHGRRV